MPNQPDNSPSLAQQFLNQIIREMDKRGLSQAALAERLGCTKANVSKLLSGKSNLTAATMERLANAVGVEVGLALGGNGAQAAAVAEGSAAGAVSESTPAADEADRAPAPPAHPKRREVAVEKARSTWKQLTPEVQEEVAKLALEPPPKTRGRKPGPLYDYSRHLAYMAKKIVESNLSERKAADRAKAWATKKKLVAVSAHTLRTHFRKNRDELLASARRKAEAQRAEERQSEAPSQAQRRPTATTGYGGGSAGYASTPMSSLNWVDEELSRIQDQYRIDPGLTEVLREPYVLEEMGQLAATRDITAATDLCREPWGLSVAKVEPGLAAMRQSDRLTDPMPTMSVANPELTACRAAQPIRDPLREAIDRATKMSVANPELTACRAAQPIHNPLREAIDRATNTHRRMNETFESFKIRRGPFE